MNVGIFVLWKTIKGLFSFHVAMTAIGYCSGSRQDATPTSPVWNPSYSANNLHTYASCLFVMLLSQSIWPEPGKWLVVSDNFAVLSEAFPETGSPYGYNPFDSKTTV
jgi:hypothetical protein